MNLQQSQSGTAAASTTRTIADIEREIVQLDATRATLLAERRAAINFAGHDEVAIGQTGNLVTLDGVMIVGLNEVMYARAGVITASRKMDGTIGLELKESVKSEDSILPSLDRNGEVEYLTVNGDIIPESQVKLVSASA